jgi:hypothetical protein
VSSLKTGASIPFLTAFQHFFNEYYDKHKMCLYGYYIFLKNFLKKYLKNKVVTWHVTAMGKDGLSVLYIK